MPIPSGVGLGFLRLDLSGLLVTDPTVETFEDVVVVIGTMLPFAAFWRLLQFIFYMKKEKKRKKIQISSLSKINNNVSYAVRFIECAAV